MTQEEVAWAPKELQDFANIDICPSNPGNMGGNGLLGW